MTDEGDEVEVHALQDENAPHGTNTEDEKQRRDDADRDDDEEATPDDVDE